MTASLSTARRPLPGEGANGAKSDYSMVGLPPPILKGAKSYHSRWVLMSSLSEECLIHASRMSRQVSPCVPRALHFYRFCHVLND